MKMKLSQLISFLLFLMSVVPSFGICPTKTLRSFNKESGFTHVMACKDEKTGMTNFHIVVDAKTFLSHFKHAFPADRAQANVVLRAINTKDFRGVTVNYGKMAYGDSEFVIRFDVPSTDLDRYELEFDCSITWGDVPVVGGEINVASLQAFRDSKDTVTESSPIWKELEKERQIMMSEGDFGSGSRSPTKKSGNAEVAPFGSGK